MPHIRMRALHSDQVAKLSSILVSELATAANTSEENFTLELVPTQFFSRGSATESFPFVEVLWFDRTQNIQDECARIITQRVKEVSAADDVVVVFTNLSKDGYYENGQHF